MRHNIVILIGFVLVRRRGLAIAIAACFELATNNLAPLPLDELEGLVAVDEGGKIELQGQMRT